MALPSVNISIQTGQLGITTNLGNGVAGLVVHMATAPAAHAFATAKKYSSYDELPSELQAVEALKLYFDIAPGYGVWIVPAPTSASVTDMVDYQHATPYAKILVDAGRGEIRFIGVVATMLAAEVTAAFTKAQALGTYFANLVNPLLVVLPYSYKTADTPADLSAMSNDRVAGLVSYAGDEIGLLLGKLASTKVHIHPGKVADGSLPIVSALLDGYADPQTTIEDSLTDVETLHDLGWNVLRTHIGKAGYYFAGQPMATNGDFSKIVNRRTIDKAHVIAYATFLEELNGEVFVTADNQLLPGYVKTLQENAKDAVSTGMANEISGVDCEIDADQDVIATDEIEAVMAVQPVGHSSTINIKLGLTKTL